MLPAALGQATQPQCVDDVHAPSPCTVSTITPAGCSAPAFSSSMSSNSKSGGCPLTVWSNGNLVVCSSGTPAAARMKRVGGDGERAQRGAVERVGEADHAGTAGDLASELHRRLDGVCPRRAGELHAVVQLPWPQDDLVKRGEKVALGGREHIQGVDHSVGAQILHEGLLQQRVVVAIVERPGAGEEVQVWPPALVGQPAADRSVKDQQRQ